MVTDAKDVALHMMQDAFAELQQAGISEQFSQLADIAKSSGGATFFGSFGSSKGVFLQVDVCPPSHPGILLTPNPKVVLHFGIRRHRQSLIGRCFEAMLEFWRIMRGDSTEYSVELKPEEIGRLKDLLRSLKGV